MSFESSKSRGVLEYVFLRLLLFIRMIISLGLAEVYFRNRAIQVRLR